MGQMKTLTNERSKVARQSGELRSPKRPFVKRKGNKLVCPKCGKSDHLTYVETVVTVRWIGDPEDEDRHFGTSGHLQIGADYDIDTFKEPAAEDARLLCGKCETWLAYRRRWKSTFGTSVTENRSYE